MKHYEIVNHDEYRRRNLEKYPIYILETLDRLWITHLDNLHHLREGISIRGYGQEDPYRLYSFDALHTFDEMLQAFFRDIIRHFLQSSATKIEE